MALFGSRAWGAYRPCSDVDLVLYGPIGEKEVDRLYTLFLESSLPFRVEVISYQTQAPRSPGLKRHIDQVGVILYEKKALMAGRAEDKKARGTYEGNFPGSAPGPAGAIFPPDYFNKLAQPMPPAQLFGHQRNKPERGPAGAGLWAPPDPSGGPTKKAPE